MTTATNRGGGKDDERDDIVAAVEEEMDRGDTATQEKVMAALSEMTQEMAVPVGRWSAV